MHVNIHSVQRTVNGNSVVVLRTHVGSELRGGSSEFTVDDVSDGDIIVVEGPLLAHCATDIENAKKKGAYRAVTKILEMRWEITDEQFLGFTKTALYCDFLDPRYATINVIP